MRIVSFSPVVPYEGIPHAGGAYVLVHLQTLAAAGHEVTLVSRDDPENREAALRLHGISVELVGGPGQGEPDLRARFRPALPDRSWERAVTGSDRVRAIVTDAELIEYQWTQTARLHRALGRIAPAPAVCVAHDVVTQLADRQAARDGIGPIERFARALRARGVRIDERASLRRMQATVTFSAKDARLLEEEVGVPGVRVIAPPLEPIDPRWHRPRSPEPGHVVFVGAFDREENADAARWLLTEIWPTVHERLPAASLRLMGANPTPEMTRAAAEDDSIQVSGYVDDLVPAYMSASVVVVPLRQGAGVKFKTVTAMLWGVPVVSTSVGVEGIAPVDSPVFASVTDDPGRFAQGVVDVLIAGDPDAGTAGRRFATARYGRGPFLTAIDDLYAELAGRDRLSS